MAEGNRDFLEISPYEWSSLRNRAVGSRKSLASSSADQAGGGRLTKTQKKDISPDGLMEGKHDGGGYMVGKHDGGQTKTVGWAGLEIGRKQADHLNETEAGKTWLNSHSREKSASESEKEVRILVNQSMNGSSASWIGRHGRWEHPQFPALSARWGLPLHSPADPRLQAWKERHEK